MTTPNTTTTTTTTTEATGPNGEKLWVALAGSKPLYEGCKDYYPRALGRMIGTAGSAATQLSLALDSIARALPDMDKDDMPAFFLGMARERIKNALALCEECKGH